MNIESLPSLTFNYYDFTGMILTLYQLMLLVINNLLMEVLKISTTTKVLDKSTLTCVGCGGQEGLVGERVGGGLFKAYQAFGVRLGEETGRTDTVKHIA